MTEVPITNNQLLTIEKPNQLITIRYRDTDRLVDIIDTLNDIELNELRNDYDLGDCEDVNKAIKMRIRGIPYKKHVAKDNFICISTMIIFACMAFIIIIFTFALYFGQ